MKEKIVLAVSCVVAFAIPLFAQTVIYRSMQVANTSAIATGTGNNLTISGSTATFASALPDTIGVGDAIQYDKDDGGTVDAICFIHGRTSSTVFTVKTAAGAEPTATSAADQNWSIFRAYTTLANIDAGTENTGIAAAVVNFDGGNRGLVAANETWHVALYRSTDGTDANFHGWTMDSTHRVRFFTPYATSEVGTTQRHVGTNSGVRFIYSGFWTTQGGTTERHFDFEGIVFVTNSSSCGSITFHSATSASLQTVKDCVFVGRNGSLCAGGCFGIVSDATQAGTLKISNCIFYNYDDSGAGNNTSIAIDINAGTVYVYNCTDFASNKSYDRDGGTAVIKNTISNDSDTDGFEGTYDAASDYNLSDRAADAPGANSKNSTNVTFVSEGGLDFHLNSADAGAGNSGTDLSADANIAVTTDIDRGARPVGANTVDMGADEGVLTAAEMNVKGKNTSIADGDATPSASDSTDFGSVLVTGATRKVTYKIFNTGETVLNISGTPKVAVAGTHAADFTVTTQPAATVAAGDSSSFVVEFNPSATGVRSATLSIANDDSDENPYNWSIQGTGTNPGLSLTGNGQSISSGDVSPSATDSTDFGIVALNNAERTVTYTINNNGTATLNITGTPRVAISGTNSADFTVTTQPSATVAVSASTTFKISFDPSGTGTRTATVSIENDSGTSPYTYAIQGEGQGDFDNFDSWRFNTDPTSQLRNEKHRFKP